MWAYESVFYQIYPIGFCGAPRVNDGITVPRIRKAADWAKHIARLGCNAVYFSDLRIRQSRLRYPRLPKGRLPPRHERRFRSRMRDSA